MDKKIKANNHDSYGTFTLIAFLVPFVGLILGAMLLAKDDKVDKKLGEHVIAISIFSIIIFGIVWMWFFGQQTTTSVQYSF